MSRSAQPGPPAAPYALRLAALALLAAALPAAAQTPAAQTPADATRWVAPRTDGAALRVVAEDATSVTIEITASWPTPFADALAVALEQGSALTPELLAALVTGGRAEMSHEVALGARVPPAVEVLAEETDWEPVPAALAGRLGALDRPAARVVNVAEMRRALVGSLALALVRVDGERIGRVRRLVARVPRPALRAAFARGGTDNPHVAVTRSVLADGTWFRIAVPREGVYRLTAAYLRDSLGVAAPDLGRVQVYGNGGRTLPAVNTAPRPADLTEVPTLQTGDGVLFFAEGPSWWDFVPPVPAVPPGPFNPAGTPEVPGYWTHDLSPFSAAAHYFVRTDAPAPRRLDAPGFPSYPDAQPLPTVTQRVFHERDLFNQERDGSGSGLDWMGEQVSVLAAGYTTLDDAPTAGITGTVAYRARVAARTDRFLSVTMNAGSEVLASVSPNPVDLTFRNIGALLSDRSIAVTRPAAANIGVTFRSSTTGNDNAKAWLDWAEAVYERAPIAAGGAVRFVTPGAQRARFEVALQGFAAAPEVWDVTEPGRIARLGVQARGGAFAVQVDASAGPREIVAFDAASAYVTVPPGRGTAVANQNLHGLAGSPAYVVVAAPEFLEQATRLADYRRTADGLESVVVTTDQIDNEFAAGSTDMRAVRDYLKFLYDRAPDAARLPQYLLLFGDGHYNFRRIRQSGQGEVVENFVPVYETENMFDRTESYTSDDYFGLLADGDGRWVSSAERVQVGIGRLPVRTPEEARDVVDKIQLYETPAALGAWRSTVTFIGDDQYPNEWDHDLHVLNADGTSRVAETTDPTLTVQKIYAPSYPLVNSVEGNRRPAATAAVVRSLNEGTLIWNYSGHGSPENLGDERYFTQDVLNALTNTTRPSIFVTATCSFGKFDQDVGQSMAEETLLRPDGGGIAMFTTVRVVYTSDQPSGDNNFGLNVALTEQMLLREPGGLPRRLGDALFRTKNTASGSSLNNRKFNLLGDPAMRIGLPRGGVQIDAPPVLRAYDEATVSGRVLRPDGTPDAGFSGVVDVEVFDAYRRVVMPQTPFPFTLGVYLPGRAYDQQTDRIYAGRATVTGGQFSATFRVPQDVSYSGQPAKVFAYGLAGAGGADAVGQSRRPVVSAQPGTRPDDATGPEVRLFLGDTTFVAGGLTGASPVFIARLSDASGINTVGAGVGHEILLTIDGDDATAVDVGRYFAGDLDTYRSGTVRFPLQRLAPGLHTARLTAWDAVNNSNTAEVSFRVSESEGLTVSNLFPYPNPTSGPTRFTFEHNQPAGTQARVQLRIYTIAGRPVRTISGDEALPGGVLPAGLVQIPWDGRDDDLDRLATGVYLFRLRIEADGTAGSEVVERVERLAIIR